MKSWMDNFGGDGQYFVVFPLISSLVCGSQPTTTDNHFTLFFFFLFLSLSFVFLSSRPATTIMESQ